MSLYITQRPSTTISGETSLWNAVGNPIVYKGQRKDFLYSQLNNNGGFVEIQFTGTDISSSFTAGDVIYFESNEGDYATAATVSSSTFTTDTLIVTDIPWAGVSAPGGFVNSDYARPLYRVEVDVYDTNDTLLNTTAFVYSPDPTGEVLIDVSAILRAYLYPDIDLNINGSEKYYIDSNAFKGFYIKYTEVWTGSSETESDDSYAGYEFYAVLSALQVRESEYGGNMAEYVCWDDGSPLSDWLTKFTRLKMWRGYPFIISTIVDEFTQSPYLGVEYYDIDDNLISNNFALAQSTEDNSLLIFHVTNSGAIPENATYARLFVVSFVSPSTYTNSSEYIFCDIIDPCPNPVMLLARNKLAGAIQWIFDEEQEYTFDYGNGIKAKRQVLLAKNLTINQWEALQDFITLGEVYRNNITELTSSVIKTHTRIGQQAYVVDGNGNKTGVLVIPTKNTTKTGYFKHTFEIEIEYPAIYAP